MQNNIQSEIQNRKKIRRKKRIKRKILKATTGITALTLTCCLTMKQCNNKKIDIFHFHNNLTGNVMTDKNNYICLEHINDYYLIELYHTGLDRSSINIARRFIYASGNSAYTNIFNNYFIAYDNDKNDFYEFVKVTPLLDILEKYDLVKEEYNYDDMVKIYNRIKDNYVFEDTSIYREALDKDKTLIKKRTFR